MVKNSAARKLNEIESPPLLKRVGFGDGPPPVRPNLPILNNARLAVIMLLAAELMFFAGLIGAFLVFRLSATVWRAERSGIHVKVRSQLPTMG